MKYPSLKYSLCSEVTLVVKCLLLYLVFSLININITSDLGDIFDSATKVHIAGYS